VAVVISLKLVYTPVDDNVTVPHKSQVTSHKLRDFTPLRGKKNFFRQRPLREVGLVVSFFPTAAAAGKKKIPAADAAGSGPGNLLISRSGRCGEKKEKQFPQRPLRDFPQRPLREVGLVFSLFPVTTTARFLAAAAARFSAAAAAGGKKKKNSRSGRNRWGRWVWFSPYFQQRPMRDFPQRPLREIKEKNFPQRPLRDFPQRPKKKKKIPQRPLRDRSIVLLLFLQKQNLATAIYLFGLGTLLTRLGLKHMRIRSHHDLAGALVTSLLLGRPWWSTTSPTCLPL
jgi:hypothetical protein